MPALSTWTSPARRRPGWEQGYAETLQHHLGQPFAYGVSDCLILPADLCDAMCGRNPLPSRMRRYRTELGAAKLMRALGLADVRDALAAVFPEVSKLKARRGDCGVLAQIVEDEPVLATMIVLGDGSAIGKSEHGIARVPVDRLLITFAIGAI